MTPALAAFAEAAAQWRAECVHKRALYIETIDRVPVTLLQSLIEHAFPTLRKGEGAGCEARSDAALFALVQATPLARHAVRASVAAMQEQLFND